MNNKNYNDHEEDNSFTEDKNEESIRIIKKGEEQIKKQSLPTNLTDDGIYSKTITFNDNEMKHEVQLKEQLQEIIGYLHKIVNQLDNLGKRSKN